MENYNFQLNCQYVTARPAKNKIDYYKLFKIKKNIKNLKSFLSKIFYS